ncbi:UDP-N-acetylmuramate dehydrogenase [Entomospira entomophila]|uniref:UDP-N-acetylenolpyruvoylglucosamine reductase n=1 Tax=Entomospira entomophila TaxID=2719988 RepID=A0A968G821_9SPIO|nr:UDP-N-acetylmuramate dehydrogenase [Entomospira entomophilus]NIZ40295.1 UDP-N-acetylmuramate dehydrogenase [Entomospira entomophilus]WDI35854.1 UDP-N-acetylmuramate dehydrogenase [Entomospira entomophilus]
MHNRLRAIIQEANLDSSEYQWNAPLQDHTWFKIGGSADLFIQTPSLEKVHAIIRGAKQYAIPIFFLGDGSNLVISDDGVEGIVLDTKPIRENPPIQIISYHEDVYQVAVSAGVLMEDLILFSIEHQLEGLLHFYGLPGTLGGALYMNARCYDGEISSHFLQATIIKNGDIHTHPYKASEWAYKISPFQKNGILIVNALLTIKRSQLSSDALLQRAQSYKHDRETKGHFRYPCAGSTFKNNRTFGMPSGQIIDQCGLKGLQYGGASISDFHANIVINHNHASASDVHQLVQTIQTEVYRQTSFQLEPEILFIGRGYPQI